MRPAPPRVPDYPERPDRAFRRNLMRACLYLPGERVGGVHPSAIMRGPTPEETREQELREDNT